MAKATTASGKVASFLKGLCFRGTITRIELRQVLRGQSTAQFVNSWNVGEEAKAGQSTDIDRIASEIIEFAEQDATGLSVARAQTYAVLGYLEGEPEAFRMPLTVRIDQGAFNPQDAFVDSEEPNMTGQWGQILRHNEANARSTQHFFARVIESYERREDRYERREAERDRLQIETLGMLRNLAMMQDERDWRLHQAKRRERLEDLAIDKVGTIGTLFMSQFSAPETVGRAPKGGPEVRALITWFVKHQTAQARAMGIFTVTQMATLQKLGKYFEDGILHATNRPEVVEALIKSFLDEVDGKQIQALMGNPDNDPPTPGLFDLDTDDMNAKAAFQALWQLYAPTPKQETNGVTSKGGTA